MNVQMTGNALCVSDRRPWSSLGDSISRRLWLLESSGLCAEARRRTRLEDFGDREIESRLSILAKSLESEANLHPFGRFLARLHLREILETRLALTDLWKSGPQDSEVIRRPIFITGLPRSGSAFLHDLLTQDRDGRGPRVWEVMCPPTGSDRNGNEIRRHIRKTAARLWWFRRIAPGADSVHPMRATTLQECVAIHSYALLSQEFVTIFRAPGYETFLNAADLTPAYELEKRFLQHLQMSRRPRRWVLRASDHVFSLEALFNVFPDAIIIQMHRDPFVVLKSSSRLTSVLRATFARPENAKQSALREAQVLAEGMARIARFRDSHPELAQRFSDVNYPELIADPLGTVCRLYGEMDLPLSNATIDRVRSTAFNRSRYSLRPIDRTFIS